MSAVEISRRGLSSPRRSGQEDGGPSKHREAAEQPDPPEGSGPGVVGRIVAGRFGKVVFVLIHGSFFVSPDFCRKEISSSWKSRALSSHGSRNPTHNSHGK